jgi:hypothetical protein
MAETEKQVMVLTAEELVMVLVGGDGGKRERSTVATGRRCAGEEKLI